MKHKKIRKWTQIVLPIISAVIFNKSLIKTDLPLNLPVPVPLTFAAFLSDPFLKQAFFQAAFAHDCFINKPSSQEDVLLSFCHHGMTRLQLVQTSDVESSCSCTAARNYPVMKWRQTVILWQDVSNRIRERRLYATRSWQDQAMGCCRLGNKLFICRKRGNFSDRLIQNQHVYFWISCDFCSIDRASLISK